MNKRQKIVQKQFLNNEEAVIEKLKSVYNQALRDVEKKAQALQAQIDNLDLELEDVEDEKEKAKLKSRKQSKVYQKQYQDTLKKQISSILDNMQVEEFKTVSEYLQKCYEEGFVGTLYDLQGQGIPLIFPIDQEAIVRAVQLDSKISKGLYKRLGEDVTLLKKNIAAEVSRGISTGASYSQIAQQIKAKMTGIYDKKSGGALFRAETIAITEGHRIQVQSGIDACYKAQEKGAEVLKQWDSTLDGATRPSHRKVDGEIRELDEPFSNGLMHPGDPAGGAAEVVRCRCALLQRARWALKGGFTKRDNFTGELREFSTPEDYVQFKKWYFSKENIQYMNYVDTLEKRYGTKDFKKILSSMTDQEYSRYKKLLDRNPAFKTSDDGIEEYGKTLYNGGIPKTWKKIDIANDDVIKNANRNYGKEKGNTINCANCAVAYEMRKRGFDVVAAPIGKNKHLVYHPEEAWENAVVKTTSKNGRTDIIHSMLEMEDGARVSVSVKWSKNGGHVFVAERKGESIVFSDPQKGIENVDWYFDGVVEGETRYWRIDNLNPSDRGITACERR